MGKLGAQVSAHPPSESDSEDGYDSDEFTPKKKLPRTGHLKTYLQKPENLKSRMPQ